MTTAFTKFCKQTTEFQDWQIILTPLNLKQVLNWIEEQLNRSIVAYLTQKLKVFTEIKTGILKHKLNVGGSSFYTKMPNVTKKHIAAKISEFKRTKIIATIGPATSSYESILDLLNSGVNGFRLNFSHGTQEEHAKSITSIRKASLEIGKPVAVIQDLQGPKIRLGDFEGEVDVETGQELRFGYKTDYERSGVIPVQFNLSKKVKRGETMYLYDGRVKAVISAVKDGIVYARAENNGVLLKRKGINMPDTDFSGEALSKKDLSDIAFGADKDIDFVAISFIQSEDDVELLRKKLKGLGSEAKVIAKLETKAASARLEQVVQASDVVMIARGDLAYEVGPEAVPLIQRQIIALCQKYSKQSIVATQMLISMVSSPEPSRAEVSDVSTAVLLGADCVMLSDETTIGEYPVETVKTMKRIARYNESHQPLITDHYHEGDKTRQTAICSAIVGLAAQVKAAAIVAETKSGATAYQIAGHHPQRPIIAVTSSKRVAQQLALTRGVKSFVRKDSRTAGRKLTDWLESSKVLKSGDVIVSASGQYPGVVGTTDTIKVRVLK